MSPLSPFSFAPKVETVKALSTSDNRILSEIALCFCTGFAFVYKYTIWHIQRLGESWPGLGRFMWAGHCPAHDFLRAPSSPSHPRPIPEGFYEEIVSLIFLLHVQFSSFILGKKTFLTLNRPTQGNCSKYLYCLSRLKSRWSECSLISIMWCMGTPADACAEP